MNLTKDKGKQVEEHYDKNPVKPVKPPTDFIAYMYIWLYRTIIVYIWGFELVKKLMIKSKVYVMDLIILNHGRIAY